MAGRQYAIVVDYPDVPPGAEIKGMWDGVMGSDHCYDGGNDATSDDGVNWWSGVDDLHFRVFIKAK